MAKGLSSLTSLLSLETEYPVLLWLEIGFINPKNQVLELSKYFL